MAWINNGANQAKQSKTNRTEPNRMNENMDWNIGTWFDRNGEKKYKCYTDLSNAPQINSIDVPE